MSSYTATTYRFLGADGLERTRYFSRQLITAADLTDDQDYFREKMRRHNRLLHGWGIVCGLEVTPTPTSEQPWRVRIDSGYALSPQGDEIYVSKPQQIDLKQHGLDDPAEILKEEEENEGAYIGIRYAQSLNRPVRVHPAGCACDDNGCEFSRVQEGFEVAVLRELPDTHLIESIEEWTHEVATYFLPCTQTSRERVFAPRPCPPCPTSLWIILAHIPPLVSGQSMEEYQLKLRYSPRRYVISFGGVYLICPEDRRMRKARVMWTNMAGVMGAVNRLVDLGDVADKAKPVAMATLSRADGSPITMEVSFTVEAGETFADVIEREGDRELYDPIENEIYQFRDLYALAEVEPDETVGHVLDFLAPLQEVRLEIGKLRESRDRLEPFLDKRGLSRLHAEYLASPSAATRLPATDIRGVSPRSQLGEKVADMQIAEIAEMSVEDFMSLALEGVPDRRLKLVEQQAGVVWDNATEIVRLAGEWGS